jgi:hypothetical protein
MVPTYKYSPCHKVLLFRFIKPISTDSKKKPISTVLYCYCLIIGYLLVTFTAFLNSFDAVLLAYPNLRGTKGYVVVVVVDAVLLMCSKALLSKLVRSFIHGSFSF